MFANPTRWLQILICYYIKNGNFQYCGNSRIDESRISFQLIINHLLLEVTCVSVSADN